MTNTQTDQMERGASTVRGRVHLNTGEIRRTARAGYFNVQEIAPLCDEIDQLRTDLKRVTAERDAMREVEQKTRRLTSKWPNRTWAEDVDLRNALARLDAKRKATADATEEKQ